MTEGCERTGGGAMTLEAVPGSGAESYVASAAIGAVRPTAGRQAR